jgi:hypothetical protein
MRSFLTLLLLGLALKALPQVVKAEYFFDNAAIAYEQGISLTVPSNTGDVQITAELPVTGLSPGFHQVFFRVKDAVKGWSPLTPVTFVRLYTGTFLGFRYGFDPQTDVNTWTYHAFPSQSSDVSMSIDIPVSGLPPGFHQIFCQARDATGEWSPMTPKTFLRINPAETIVGFRYCFDAGTEAWSYRNFPSPSADVSQNVELDLGTLPKGIHYFQAMAKTATGIWSPISSGTFFNIYSEPLNITALEYYFEDESGVAGSLFKVNNFTPSPNVTLDSVTFSIPVGSLVNLKTYYVYIRGVNEVGERSQYMKDTIVYHASTTGIKDLIQLTPKIMVFPNPVSEMVSLKFIPLENKGDLIIRIVDETGRIAAEKEFSFSEVDNYTIDASGLISGIYRIVISTKNGKPVARATFVKK